MVLLFQENKIYLSDLLGIAIQNFQLLYCRLVKFYNEVTKILKPRPIRNQNSKFCGLFCFYIARVMFGYKYLLMLDMNNNDLLRFAKHVL